MNHLKKILLLILSITSSLSFSTTVSLKDKIGQMFIIGFEGKTIEADAPIIKAIEENNIGGVILFDYNPKTKQFDKNIESPAQVQALNQSLQKIVKKANLSHLRDDVPLLISVDYEGGKVNRLRKEYGFPETYSAKTVGQMSKDQAKTIAQTMTNTLKSSGFNLNFSPILDLDINPENPIIGKLERSFSPNPYTVAAYAHLFSMQFLEQGIQCAYKHFPGHGSSEGDSHLGFVDVTDTWHEQELIPYQEQFAQTHHCGMVMAAHLVNRKLDLSGVPATLSYAVLTGLLRHQLQFDGVIITDDMQMKAITDNYELEQALTMAINAGADMLIFGNQLSEKPQEPAELIDIVMKKIATGEISEQRIEEAYQHIMQLKHTLA
ncbi:glycoside hydrolase family 3 protein [Legionella nagasakiensis]|uniref:glycoside hydrolase family 3 protein n=1 Tax=Legionella nagasakiensis TaxID=535290 RepID=UPI00105471E4|nr:glycoside hydrolase family 3 N-terminal domain-containing protein [Legionella nagasakiensis]